MKKEKKTNPRLRRTLLLARPLMMIIFSLYCFALSAQSSATTTTQSQDAGDLSKVNPALAEFVKNNPTDGASAQALKYAMILNDPASFSEFSQNDLERMKSEQKELMNRFEFIQNKIKDCQSYDKAAAIYQREHDRKALMDKATNPNRVATPSNEQNAVPVLINGNQ